MKDEATFNEGDLARVYGDQPICLLTLSNVRVEKHHILGRGSDFGIRPKDERRKWFSSIYNCAPVIHSFHHGGYRDHRYMRMLLLEIVEQKVRESGHIPNENDLMFLNLRDGWLIDEAAKLRLPLQ